MKVSTEPRPKKNGCDNPGCKTRTKWVYVLTVGEATVRLCRPCGREWRHLWYRARPEES